MPGEFLVPLDAYVAPLGLERCVAGLLLTWVEVEVRGFDDLVEEMCRLRGAVMAAGALG